MAGVRNGKIMLLVVTMIIMLEMVSAHEVVGKRTRLRNIKIRRYRSRINKPAVKTIKSEDGDLIDCIDIYKQPAFDHPLLKNHTIQMWPTNYQQRGETNARSRPLQQTWWKSGSCPQGTIPVLRTRRRGLLRAASFAKYGKKYPSLHGNISQSLAFSGTIEKAGALVGGGPYFGGKAHINVWTMHVEPGEYSQSKMQIGNFDRANENSVQVGVTVNPQVFGDYRLRIYIYWTADGFAETGCFNLKCPGFVQINNEYTLGSTIWPTSSYDGTQDYFDFQIYKDAEYHNWWLQIGDTPVGYWPIGLFRQLDSAAWVQWIGEILNKASGGRHTITQMGSGHFSNEGFKRSAYFRYTSIITYEGGDYKPTDRLLTTVMDKPHCYDARIDDAFVYFGGPGVGIDCV